jgi:NAD(P)H-dependent FMN reductase
MNLLAISGSVRRHSTNGYLLAALSGVSPAGVNIEVFHDPFRRA